MDKAEQRVRQIKAIRRIEIARTLVSAFGALIGFSMNAVQMHEGALKWHDPILPACWLFMTVAGCMSVRMLREQEKLELRFAKLISEREEFYRSLERDLDDLHATIDASNRRPISYKEETH